MRVLQSLSFLWHKTSHSSAVLLSLCQHQQPAKECGFPSFVRGYDDLLCGNPDLPPAFSGPDHLGWGTPSSIALMWTWLAEDNHAAVAREWTPELGFIPFPDGNLLRE